MVERSPRTSRGSTWPMGSGTTRTSPAIPMPSGVGSAPVDGRARGYPPRRFRRLGGERQQRRLEAAVRAPCAWLRMRLHRLASRRSAHRRTGSAASRATIPSGDADRRGHTTSPREAPQARLDRSGRITVVAVSTTTGVRPRRRDPRPNAGDYAAACGGIGGPRPSDGSHGSDRRLARTTGSMRVPSSTRSGLDRATMTATGDVRLVPSAGIVADFMRLRSPAGPATGHCRVTASIAPEFDVVWRGTHNADEKDRSRRHAGRGVADDVRRREREGADHRAGLPLSPQHGDAVWERIRATTSAARASLLGRSPRRTDATTRRPPHHDHREVFAPLVLREEAIGDARPRTVQPRPFAKIKLRPGKATMDDCCKFVECALAIRAVPLRSG